MQRIAVSGLTAGDVLVAISSTGRTRAYSAGSPAKARSPLSSSASMLGTISTPSSFTFSVYSGTRCVLDGMSLEPCG